MVGGRRPSVEDDVRWKTTSVGRRPLVEEIFGWRPPTEEGDLRWKTTFGGRRPKKEDNILCWKTTYCGRGHLLEDDLWRTLHAAYSALGLFLGARVKLGSTPQGLKFWPQRSCLLFVCCSAIKLAEEISKIFSIILYQMVLYHKRYYEKLYGRFIVYGNKYN